MVFLFYMLDYGKAFTFILFLINDLNSQKKENEPLYTKNTLKTKLKNEQKLYVLIYALGWSI